MRGILAIAASIGVLGGTPPPTSTDDIREIRGLSLRGKGCHVELLDADGSTICRAIAMPFPRCFPLTVFARTPDGGMAGERLSLGSSCSPPRLTSAALGPGYFFVESDAGSFGVICDNASKCQRDVFSEQIRSCCRKDVGIQNTAICTVTPQHGVCVEEDEDDSLSATERGSSDTSSDGGRTRYRTPPHR